MTRATRPLRAMIALLIATACALALAAPAAATPDRVKVAPGVFLQSAAAATPDAEPRARRRAPDDRNGKIVGGVATTVAQYPWQVAVAYNDALFTGDGYQRQFCGGTLVAPNVVITAAHCVYDNPAPGGFNNPINFESFTGRTVLSSSEGQVLEWSDYYFFSDASGTPLFNPSTYDFDAIFVVLSGSSVSPPVKVAGADEAPTWAPNAPAFISGWGDQAAGAGDYPDQLRAARVLITPDSFCQGPSSYGSDFHPDVMLCAGVPAGGVDTCQGDSGGPIVVPVSGGGFRLVGDTSWGIGCASAQFPGVYGRIAGGTTMGNGLQSGIQAVTGQNVYGSGARPLTTPDARFTKKPKNKVKTKRKKAKVKFAFTSDEPGATFTCQLDKQPAKSCSSPYKKKVKKGKHTMRVVGTNFIGDSGPTATDKFKVKQKKKKKKKGRR